MTSVKEPPSADRFARLVERAERERRARLAAEGILEQKSREIYELNQHLEQLVRERTRALDVTLDNISQGIVMLGADGQVRVCNRRAGELLETHSGPDGVAALLSQLLAEQNPLRDIATRFEDRRPSGRVIEVRCEWLVDGALVVTLTDISQIKEREARLKAVTAAAEAANEAKSRFLSTMSHEMRTPLNGVIGALELLADLPLAQDQLFYVDTALQAGEALLAQINDVLDFSKLEAGKIDLVAEPVELQPLTRAVLDILQPQAKKRGNRLTLTVGPDVPAAVLGDTGRIRQVLLNLAGNAVKFTEGGSIDVSIRRVGGTDAQPELDVSVTDTGPGIPDERLDQLFREFSMLDASYARKAGGTGLGLAIVDRLVTAMGGSVGVASRVGVGSRFWFRVALPVVRQAPEAARPVPAGGSPVLSTGGPRLSILIVDDNATNRLIGSRMLQAIGHTTETASDGLQAVEFAQSRRFDAILMDISMPVLDGLEATRRIRALGHGRDVPIIALTANALAGDRERFLAAGMDDYLTKPLRRADLEACLDRLTRSVVAAA